MLRTRPPRSTPERVRARLACIRHAASVDPEPGSNSPPMTPKGRRPRKVACLSCPRPSQLPETRHRVETRMLVAACDGHACCDWLGIAVCESQMVASPSRFPRTTRQPSARSVFGTRRDGASGKSCQLPIPSVRCASLSTCSARSPGQPRYGRCGFRRFTRPIRPPVPRSGVAPLRSLQSLPYVRPLVKGYQPAACRRCSREEAGPRRSVSQGTA